VSANPPLTDPAILTLGRRPPATKQANTGEKRDPQPAPIPVVQIQSASVENTPTASIFESLNGLKISDAVSGLATTPTEAVELPAEVSAQDTQGPTQKKRRRNRKSTQIGNGILDELHSSPQASHNSKTPGKGKGWRQTPILQSTSSFQPFNSLKKGGIKDDNGWASEDVTDVQEMGEFDFEGGLAKFDKQNLFEQMRKDDQIDEADRLVSHNRQPRPKPGTAGGKNLHYSENVLDVPSTMGPKSSKERLAKETANDFWNSEADDAGHNGGDRMSGRELGSRQSSRRGENKATTSKRSQSRKASAVAATQGPVRVNSGVSFRYILNILGNMRLT
jgi:enhancer of mRNA-decapping protein 3